MTPGMKHDYEARKAEEKRDRESRGYRNDGETNNCYLIQVPDGWLLYTPRHVCKAHLRESAGWTYPLASETCRIVNGDTVGGAL